MPKLCFVTRYSRLTAFAFKGFLQGCREVFSFFCQSTFFPPMQLLSLTVCYFLDYISMSSTCVSFSFTLESFGYYLDKGTSLITSELCVTKMRVQFIIKMYKVEDVSFEITPLWRPMPSLILFSNLPYHLCIPFDHTMNAS